MIDRRNLQAHYPFGRLNRLLEARAAADWSRYPLPRGTLDYREACVDWLALRYGLPTGMIDPETMVLAVPGTREGLFFAALANTPGDGGAAVLIPNPCYHVYYSATAAAGAEPVFVSATAETGFQPDYTALDPALLDRTALAYFCTPSNPQGAIADLDQLQALIRLARAHDFTIAFDECYAEIYTGAPPPGALQAAAALGGSLDNLLVFHSLSKRSSAPGLRCGFAAGDPKRIEALAVLMSTGGAGVPGGGFFLWLEVGDGEAAALKLWREAGIKVLPGAYMCQGADGEPNPGAAFIRIALIYDADYTEAALRRVVEVL